MAPIHDAAWVGDLQKVKDIADADPSAVHATDEVSRPQQSIARETNGGACALDLDVWDPTAGAG